MKRSYLFAGLAGIVVLAGLGWGYSSQLSRFKESLAQQKAADRERVLQQKPETRSRFLAEFPGQEALFDEHFSIDRALVERDTLFRFLFFSKQVPYPSYSINYLPALAEECEVILYNSEEGAKLDQELEQVKKEFGFPATNWIKRVDRNLFFYTGAPSDNHQRFFPNSFFHSFNEEAVSELRTFLTEYKSNQVATAQESAAAKSSAAADLRAGKRYLPQSGRPDIDANYNLKKTEILQEGKKSFTFDGQYIGALTYNFPQVTYRPEILQKIVEEAFYDVYQNNSLRNGATPYARCYGANKKCSFYGCSEITVNSGPKDVLVTIKNTRGKVVRHGYIRASTRYSFELPDGTYSVYFYSGKGWNPGKAIKTKRCGTLRGGFLTDAGVTKDDEVTLEGHIMEYTLSYVQNGNFNPEASSLEEAM